MLFCDKCGRKLYWIECHRCGEGDYVCECGKWPTNIIEGRVDGSEMDRDFCADCSVLDD